MGAAQAMETAGAQALGTEASTEQERTWLAKRLGNKTEAHLQGHTQYARGFLPYPWNSGKSPGLRFPMCHSGCFGKNSFQGDMELDTSWMITIGAEVNRDHSWTRGTDRFKEVLGWPKSSFQPNTWRGGGEHVQVCFGVYLGGMFTWRGTGGRLEILDECS